MDYGVWALMGLILLTFLYLSLFLWATVKGVVLQFGHFFRTPHVQLLPSTTLSYVDGYSWTGDLCLLTVCFVSVMRYSISHRFVS